MGDMVNHLLRWVSTAVSLAISFGLAMLVMSRLPSAGFSLADGPGFVARGAGEMMLYLLPLWAADVVAYVVVSARPSHLEFEVVASNDHVHEQDHGHDGYGQEANPA